MFIALLLFIILLIAGTLFLMTLIEFIFTANIYLVLIIFAYVFYAMRKYYLNSIKDLEN